MSYQDCTETWYLLTTWAEKDRAGLRENGAVWVRQGTQGLFALSLEAFNAKRAVEGDIQ